MAAVELALRKLTSPDMNGLQIEDIMEAGERLPGMAALWDVATAQERREMLVFLLEPHGLSYDLETQQIAAITPRPMFLPLLRLIEGVQEHDEAPGTLVSSLWRPITPHLRGLSRFDR